MDQTLDFRLSEFDTQSQADTYDAWFHAKIAAARQSQAPAIPHDEVVARARARMAERMDKLKAAADEVKR